jgi:hypothetical protein
LTQAVTIDIAQTNPATIGVATLPGGFELRLTCWSGADPKYQNTVELAALSTTDGDANYDWIATRDVTSFEPIAYGRTLPAGTFEVVDGTYVSPGSTIRYEGQLVLHAGANVTAVTFHEGVDPATGNCQLTGVATAGH